MATEKKDKESQKAVKRTKMKASPMMKTITFAIVGVISLVMGILGIFLEVDSVSTLALIGGNTIIALAVIDFINMFRMEHKAAEFAFSLMRAGAGLAIGILMIVNHEQNMAWPLILLSIYTIGRGILEVLTTLIFNKDKTERALWVICGIAACILGIIILNSGAFADKTTFYRVFSIYLAVYGITALVSSVYQRKLEKKSK